MGNARGTFESPRKLLKPVTDSEHAEHLHDVIGHLPTYVRRRLADHADEDPARGLW
jgi:hypothetical protein